MGDFEKLSCDVCREWELLIVAEFDCNFQVIPGQMTQIDLTLEHFLALLAGEQRSEEITIRAQNVLVN